MPRKTTTYRKRIQYTQRRGSRKRKIRGGGFDEELDALITGIKEAILNDDADALEAIMKTPIKQALPSIDTTQYRQDASVIEDLDLIIVDEFTIPGDRDPNGEYDDEVYTIQLSIFGYAILTHDQTTDHVIHYLSTTQLDAAVEFDRLLYNDYARLFLPMNIGEILAKIIEIKYDNFNFNFDYIDDSHTLLMTAIKFASDEETVDTRNKLIDIITILIYYTYEFGMGVDEFFKTWVENSRNKMPNRIYELIQENIRIGEPKIKALIKSEKKGFDAISLDMIALRDHLTKNGHFAIVYISDNGNVKCYIMSMKNLRASLRIVPGENPEYQEFYQCKDDAPESWQGAAYTRYIESMDPMIKINTEISFMIEKPSWMTNFKNENVPQGGTKIFRLVPTRVIKKFVSKIVLNVLHWDTRLSGITLGADHCNQTVPTQVYALEEIPEKNLPFYFKDADDASDT